MSNKINKRLIWGILSALAAIVIFVLLFFSRIIFSTDKATPDKPGHTVQSISRFIPIKIKDKELKVEIARTPAEQQQGLSGRNNLSADTGMLFVYNKPIRAVFWMKNMRFPLDIIWIAEDRVVGFEQNVSVPAVGTAEDKLPTYVSPQKITAVLEVNAGFVQANNIQRGDTVVALGLEPRI